MVDLSLVVYAEDMEWSWLDKALELVGDSIGTAWTAFWCCYAHSAAVSLKAKEMERLPYWLVAIQASIATMLGWLMGWFMIHGEQHPESRRLVEVWAAMLICAILGRNAPSWEDATTRR